MLYCLQPNMSLSIINPESDLKEMQRKLENFESMNLYVTKNKLFKTGRYSKMIE